MIDNKFINLWFDQKTRDKMINDGLKEKSSFLVAWIGYIITTNKIKRANDRYIEFLEYHKNNDMEKVLDIIYDWKDETDGWRYFDENNWWEY